MLIGLWVHFVAPGYAVSQLINDQQAGLGFIKNTHKFVTWNVERCFFLKLVAWWRKICRQAWVALQPLLVSGQNVKRCRLSKPLIFTAKVAKTLDVLYYSNVAGVNPEWGELARFEYDQSRHPRLPGYFTYVIGKSSRCAAISQRILKMGSTVVIALTLRNFQFFQWLTLNDSRFMKHLKWSRVQRDKENVNGKVFLEDVTRWRVRRGGGALENCDTCLCLSWRA